MSEKLPKRHEQNHGHESSRETKRHKERLSQATEKRGLRARHEHADNISEIRGRVEAASKSGHEQARKDNEKAEHEQPVLVNKELKELSYRRTLRRVQNKLPAPARAFSRFVHSPAIETISEVAGKTVARPSGVLAGGIFAFLGSSIFLWIARHYGYEYNFLLFALFFIGGFFAGLLLELVIKLAGRRLR